ncbi:hypothetical protein [Mycolicibacterium sp. XJ870]
MNGPLAWTAAAFMLGAAVGASACAQANPEPPPPGPPQSTPPRADSPCSESFEGVLTRPGPSAGQPLLHCNGGVWQQLHNPYPSSDRWLTTGPELIVHGQGRRNPEAKAGAWTGTPQTAEARCSAERVDVVAAGETSAPEKLSADPGRPLTFEVSDHMFTVTFSGYCLWQRG